HAAGGAPWRDWHLPRGAPHRLRLGRWRCPGSVPHRALRRTSLGRPPAHPRAAGFVGEVRSMKADALLVLKPDILSGPYAWCSGGLARDTIRGVLAAYGDLPADPYEAPDSEGAVRWGLRNIARKVEARGWYTTHLDERDERLRSLRQLLRASDVADAEGLPTADLVLTVARALGFSLAV